MCMHILWLINHSNERCFYSSHLTDFYHRSILTTCSSWPSYQLEIANNGLTAEYMQPSFPTLTFPNHYSMITGLYPSSHGIVANMFYDPKFNQDFNYKIPDKSWDPKWWGGQPVSSARSLSLSMFLFLIGLGGLLFRSRHTDLFAFHLLWLLIDLGNSSAPEPKVGRYHVARWRIWKTRSTNIPHAIQIQQPNPGESRCPSEMDRSSKGRTPDRHGGLHLGGW